MKNGIISIGIIILATCVLFLLRHFVLTVGKRRTGRFGETSSKTVERDSPESDSNDETDMKATPIRSMVCAIVFTLLYTGISTAQQSDDANTKQTLPTARMIRVVSPAAGSSTNESSSIPSERERLLLERIEGLERRLAEIESRSLTKTSAESPRSGIGKSAEMALPDDAISKSQANGYAAAQVTQEDRGVLDFFRDTTFNLTVDGYYSYNFNHPVGRVNLLRAYDVSHNSQEPQRQQSKPEWNYGGFMDVGYLLDFNHPSNRLFRSRGTAFHVNEVDLNMTGAYVKKKASEESRWGAELTVHAGKDSEVFGFSATAPNFPGYEWMRHFGPTNVSYLAPVGKGLTLQGGIFGSLIGYDSLYAKDNFTYTRPWGADFTPYLMMGVNASYPFNERLTGTFFVVNGYWHLANANGVPSSGGQLVYKASPRVTVKETVLWGPHQSNTSFKFWRFLSDSLVERRGDRITFAFEYLTSWERVDTPGDSCALMMAGQLPVHWALNKRWSATVRPEFFWDRDGRWTLVRQTVKALTTTLEYRIPYRQTNTILRLEHRYDDSRGPDGGFFRGAEVPPGVVGLTPAQHLLTFSLIFTFGR